MKRISALRKGLLTGIIAAGMFFSTAHAGNIVATDTVFYTYADMISDLQEMQDTYPGLIQIDTIASTRDGRDIVDVVVGNSSAEHQILIQASIHGREYINTQVAMYQIEELLSGYENGSWSGRLLRELYGNVCFHILPMMNPDGVTVSQYGPDGMRDDEVHSVLQYCYASDKLAGYASQNEYIYWMNWKANGIGVDLNRNYDAGWDSYQGHSSISYEQYKGTSPASEIETRALLELADRIQPDCVIAYHSAGNLVYWDYGSMGAIYDEDKKLASLVSSVTGYKMESTLTGNTDAAGCSDYFVLKREIPAVTIENGKGDSPLPYTELPSILQANRELLPELAAYFAGNKTIGMWERNQNIAHWSPVDQNYNITISRPVDTNVYLADVYDFITLREAPSTQATAICTLPPETEMEILEYTSSEMVKVYISSTGQTGYVNSEYLTKKGEPLTRAGKTKTTSNGAFPGSRCHLLCEEFVTLRNAPSVSGDEIRKVYKDEVVVVIDVANDEFCYVSTEDGLTGYVMSSYLKAE